MRSIEISKRENLSKERQKQSEATVTMQESIYQPQETKKAEKSTTQRVNLCSNRWDILDYWKGELGDTKGYCQQKVVVDFVSRPEECEENLSWVILAKSYRKYTELHFLYARGNLGISLFILDRVGNQHSVHSLFWHLAILEIDENRISFKNVLLRSVHY